MRDQIVDVAETAEAQMVYDDDYIRVIWQAGRSDFILVTFGNMINLADGIRFFGDLPVQKLGISCVGFVAKEPNWFPEDSAGKAIAAINRFFLGVREIVAYGGSMGGYAAIKYSAALRATTVVAFCPQWSIDRAECGGHNPGFQEYFSEKLSGMGIKPEDISGNLFLFFDPKHKNDVFHAERITSKSGSVKHILVRSVGHFVTGALAGTSNMNAIINMARANNHIGLCKLADAVRRGHHIRVRTVLNKLSVKHPYLLKKVMQTQKNISQLDYNDIASLNTKLLKTFSVNHQSSSSVEVIDSLRLGAICPVRSRMLGHYKEQLIKEINFDQSVIRTHHKTIVAYSAVDGGLVHRQKADILASVYLLPVGLYKYLGFHVFGVYFEGRLFICQVSSAGGVRLGDAAGAELALSSLIIGSPVAQELIYPKCGAAFVTAEKNGTISFNRKVAKEWEAYQFS